MKIKKMVIRNFRIYKGCYYFDFADKDIIIIYGQNGNGKSCLFDAIEWCFTGELSRYKGSREEQKFNYLIHSDAYDSNKEMYVEIEVEDYIGSNTIRRQLTPRSGSSYIKEIFINGVKSNSLSSGNNLIKNIISKSDSDELVPDHNIFKSYFSSTQILSQDKLTEFVHVTKPQERFSVMENILGLSRYGKDFKDYIKNLIKSETEEFEQIKNNKEEINKKISSIATEIDKLNSLMNLKKEMVSNKGIINKETIIKKIVNFIEKYEGICNINEDTGSKIILDKLNVLKSSLDYDIRDKNNIISTLNREMNMLNPNIQELKDKIELENVNKKELKTKFNEHKLQIEKLNREIKVLENYKALNQEYSRNYEINKQLVNQNQEIVARIKASKDMVLKIKGPGFNTIDEVKRLYESHEADLKVLEYAKKLKLNNQRILEFQHKVSEYDRKILELKKTVNSKERDIEKITLDISNLDSNNNLTFEESTSSLITEIQELLKNRTKQFECIVCGSPFDDHLKLKVAINKQKKLLIEKLDSNSDCKIKLNMELKKLSEDKNSTMLQINELIKNIDKMNDDCSSIKAENALIESRIPKKYLGELDTLISREHEISNFLKLNRDVYGMINLIINEEKELDNIKKQIVSNERIRANIIEKVDNESLLMDINKVEENISSLNLDLSQTKNSEIYFLKKLDNCEDEIGKLHAIIKKHDNSVERVKKIISNFSGNINDITVEINAFNQHIQNLEQKYFDVDGIIDNYNLYLNNNDYERYLLEIKKLNQILDHKIQQLKEKDILEASSNSKLLCLDKIISDSESIHSELMNDFINNYNKIIDTLYTQITPHVYNRHVNLVVKDSELFILLSEKKFNSEFFKDYDIAELKSFSNASLTLSSAQSNILAVCVFIAMNMSQEWSKLNFIGIDDPFQNMDDINVFSFVDVVSNIIGKKQTMISTHNDKFADLLSLKSSIDSSRICHINLRTYSRNRVKISSECVTIKE